MVIIHKKSQHISGALKNQKAFTYLEGKRVFYNPRTNTPWETDGQIRKTCWAHILKKAGVRYRNQYQTLHTYASMMLFAGENSLWVATQMGHKDTEMIIKHYGRWIPDKSTVAGYQPVNNWVLPLEVKGKPIFAIISNRYHNTHTIGDKK